MGTRKLPVPTMQGLRAGEIAAHILPCEKEKMLFVIFSQIGEITKKLSEFQILLGTPACM